MPKTSQSCPIDFKSLISENCHILYNRPVSHFVLGTRHNPDSDSSKQWVSSITSKRGETFGLPFFSGYGSTVAASLEDLHLASSQALASHVEEKGWATGVDDDGDDDDDTSDDDGDDLDDLESFSSASSASTLCKDRKPSINNRDSGELKNAPPAPRLRCKPPVFCMPNPATISPEEHKVLHQPIATGPPVVISGFPRPSPPRSLHSGGAMPQAPPLRSPKLTRITIKDASAFSYSFVEVIPHLWEPVTQAALREYALNKPGARLAGSRARVSSVVEGGVRTTLKCALRDLAPLVRGGHGLVEFVVDMIDK